MTLHDYLQDDRPCNALMIIIHVYSMNECITGADYVNLHIYKLHCNVQLICIRSCNYF